MKKTFFICLTLLLSIGLAQGQKNITGTVTGDGDPLIGVSVLVQGTTLGTVTNIDGTYNISVPNEGVLIFSYTGFASQNIQIGSSDVINVNLEAGNLFLDEVVVTAYGSQSKRQITGAVASVKSEEIEKIQNSHVVQGLTGKIAGVQIIAQSGQPGDAPSVRFRGIGSINASNQPLYVVDGVPFNGNVNAIATQDIESINFVKDASANALYGSRGANGVIIITTKKGDTEGVRLSFDSKIGVNTRAVPEYDIITDPGQYYETWFDRWRIGLMNQGMTQQEATDIASTNLISGGDFSLGYNNYNLPDEQVLDPATGKIRAGAQLLYNDSWDEELFSSSLRTESHLSIRTKKDNIGSFLSVGFLDDQGYALQSGFQRISGRAALDFEATEWLDIGGNINYANTEQDAPIQNVGNTTYSNLFGWARNVAPIYPVYGRDASGANILDANGERIYDFGELGDGIPGVRPYGAFNNPVGTSILDQDNNSLNNLSSRLYVKIKFLKDFSFVYNFSADNISSNITAFSTPIGGDAKGVNGRLTTTSNRANTVAHQQLLNWTNSFGDHTFSALLGHESNDYEFSLLRAQKTEALLSNLPVLNNASNIQYAEGYEKKYTVEGFFSRLNYDFANKYFLNASVRRDGSSVFDTDNRWGTFFGFGAAWDISQESFLTNAGWISSFRLRSSYGQQGNDAILYETLQTIVGDADNRNYYSYVDQFNVVNAGGGTPGVSFLALGNPDLVWETSSNLNFGFDLGILNDRLQFEVEYFIRKVDDLLFYRPLPLSEGRGSFPDNVGDMENKGIELGVKAVVIRKPDFLWSVNLNATHFDNKITKLPQEFIDNINFRLVEGKSRYEYYMREFAGVSEENGDAMWYMDEVDGNGNPTGIRTTTSEYTSATEYFVGKSAVPDLYGGFTTGLVFKGISFDIHFSYQVGGYGFDGVYQSLLGASPDVGNNYHKDVLNTWTPENKNSNAPRLDFVDTQNDNTSDYWLTDASYLSLQDIYLSYDLPSSIFSQIGISSLRVYASASNVHLWSKRQGYDPRLSVVGTTTNEYSLMRSVSFGVNASF
jgi:TonB-linked SusC/RagA family outer membrane protein